MTRVNRSIAATVAVLALSAAAQVSAATIDFESFNLGGALFLDTSESIVFPNVNGSGVTVTINGGADLRVYDLVQFGGYAFPGPQALIDIDWNTFTNPNGTDIVFDAP